MDSKKNSPIKLDSQKSDDKTTSNNGTVRQKVLSKFPRSSTANVLSPISLIAKELNYSFIGTPIRNTKSSPPDTKGKFCFCLTDTLNSTDFTKTVL